MGDLDLLFSKSSRFATFRSFAKVLYYLENITDHHSLGGERVADVEGLESFVLVLHPLCADLDGGVTLDRKCQLGTS